MDSSAGPDRPPRQLLAAVCAWWAAAVLAALHVVAMWTSRDGLVGLLVEQGASRPDAESRAQSLLVLNTSLDALVALAYFAMSVLTYRRLPWARMVLTAFGLLDLVRTMGAGTSNFLLAAVLVLALVLTWWPASSRWIAGEHG
ncbi:hypothetical protein [Saccharopolyspora taberi]|uniref:Uncharacterized protein n=1 Tax=Saccharopolyspora taberi TaxID=60895 RepID=A0ABN3VM16_9PSEU